MPGTYTIAQRQERRVLPASSRAVPRETRAAWLLYPAVLAGLYAVAILIASIALHPILAWTAELDNYVGQARRLGDGILPNDGFHPLGYPVLIWLVAPLVGDWFLAARVVSAISAGVLVWATHRLVRDTFGTFAAWATMALVAVHPTVVDAGIQMNSDMLAAAASTLTLVLAQRAIGEPSLWRVVWLGLAFGFSYWARYPAMALLVAIVPVLWMSETRGFRERAMRCAVFAGSAIVGLTPHFGLTFAQFGELLHDESWRNLAMAHFGRIDGGLDFDVLHTTPFDSWMSVILYQPATLLAQGAAAIAKCFVHDLPMILTGDATWPAGWVEWTVYAAVPIGWVAALRLRRPILVLGGLFALLYLSVTAVVLGIWDRLVLLCLPALLGAASSLLWWTGVVLRRAPRVALAVRLAGALALIAYVAAGVPQRMRDLRRAEPHEELQAISDIALEHGPGVVIGTIMCQLAEHVPFVPRWLPRDYGTVDDRCEFHAPDYVVECVEMAATSDLDYIVIGAVTFGGDQNDGHARIEALRNAPLPPDFERVREDEEVVVWRVRKPFTSKDWRPAAAGWRPSVEYTPNPVERPDALELRIDCSAGAGEVRSIDLLIEDPNGTNLAVPNLPRVGPLVSLDLHSSGFQPGEWRMRARVRLSTGLVYGPESVLTVR
jgi:hypothetical protein